MLFSISAQETTMATETKRGESRGGGGCGSLIRCCVWGKFTGSLSIERAKRIGENYEQRERKADLRGKRLR